MEQYPRNQERVEMVPFELKVTSSALPFSLGAVRRAYVKCVRRDGKLYHRGRPIADHGVPRFDYAVSRVRQLAHLPLIGSLLG